MARRTRLLFVGDSVTAGFGVGPVSAYPQLVAGRLADRGIDVEVLVDALDGADSAYVLKRFDRMITAHDPDWVVVALGLNDARPPRRAVDSPLGTSPLGTSQRAPRSPTDFADNMLAIVDRLLAIGTRAVLLIPTPRFDAPAGGAPAERAGVMAPYVAALRKLAAELQLPTIDVYQSLLAEPDLPELIPDGVHAGKEGHAAIADVVTEELLSLLGGATKESEVKVAATVATAPPSSSRRANR